MACSLCPFMQASVNLNISKQAPKTQTRQKGQLAKNSLPVCVCKPANYTTCFRVTYAASQPIISHDLEAPD